MTLLVSSGTGRLRLDIAELDLPCALPEDVDLPRLPTGDEGDLSGVLRPKNIRDDHGDFSSFGESERAERFFVRTADEVLSRGTGGGGGALGVRYLSAGFMVLISPLAMELIDALRHRRG
jgi:hypothetical protein